jgi:hypothetical protein
LTVVFKELPKVALDSRLRPGLALSNSKNFNEQPICFPLKLYLRGKHKGVHTPHVRWFFMDHIATGAWKPDLPSEDVTLMEGCNRCAVGRFHLILTTD